MTWSVMFFVNSIFLGVGLAMDAFSVSMANGLNEPDMKKARMCLIAGTYGIFQIAMPLIGWVCVHTIVTYFSAFQKFIPWIALLLLLYIGGKMLIEGIRKKEDDEGKSAARLGGAALLIQGIATSIDALSVGFTISDYGPAMAVTCAVIVGVTTFIICMIGLKIGKVAGKKLSNKASILGGVILIAIGIEIFVRGVFF